MTAVLHYIYDPLCGWCYGAEPLVVAASGVAELELHLAAGGLFAEPTRLPESMRQYIREADQRVAQLTGQPYGKAYVEDLLSDPNLVLHSRPAIAAVLAADALSPGRALDMVRAIQHAHWEAGRHVVRQDVLRDIAVRLELDGDAFDAALAAAPVDAHIEDTLRLMRRVGATGFPAFVLEVGGQLHGVPHHRFASSPPAFAAWLRDAIDAHAGMPIKT